MKYTIVVDKQSSTNPSTEKRQYTIDIEELRTLSGISDTLTVTTETTYVTRRLQLSEYGILSVLPAPKKEDLKDLNITLFEGENYIYILDKEGNKISLSYLIKNDFNDVYATRNEMNSAITQSAQSIELSVNQKLEGYSTTEEMNAAINVKAGEITSTVSKTYETKENAQSQYTQIKQTTDGITSTVSSKAGKDEVCSIVSQSAEEILLKGNRVLIESDFYDLSKEGKVTITDSTKENATAEQKANFTVQNEDGSRKAEIIPNRILLSGGSAKSYLWNTTTWAYIGVSSDNELGRCRMISAGSDLTFIDCSDGIDTSKITPKEITSPKLTQTSLENIKKNISIYNENALGTILNSDIYTYNLKSEKDTDNKHIGFVIGEGYRTPKQVINNEGNAIELYSAIGILWKGMQEQQKKIEELERKLKEVSNG